MREITEIKNSTNYPNELMKARLYDKFLNSALLSI